MIPTDPTAPDRAVVLNFRARRAALQECAANRRIWALIDDARELRERILALDADRERVDPADAPLAALGLTAPTDNADFTPGTFDYAIKHLLGVAESIAEHLGMTVGEMPPPPADRRAAA